VEKIYKEIGANIKKARKLKGLNQYDLAKKLDLTRSSMANIEAGKQRLSIDKLITISKITGFSFSMFVYDSGRSEMPEYLFENIELLKLVDKLPPNFIRAMIKLYRSVGLIKSTGESNCTLCGVVGSALKKRNQSPYDLNQCSYVGYK
jgi:transcriptional regulator with XRE-family HTH domain